SVTGSTGNYRATHGNTQLYSGSDYRLAIQTALASVGSGQRVAVMASGSIGANTIFAPSGRILEVCATLNDGNRSGRGGIVSTHTPNAELRYLTMAGHPYFGLRFFGTRGVRLGQITMNLSGGLGIRFERDQAD